MYPHGRGAGAAIGLRSLHHPEKERLSGPSPSPAPANHQWTLCPWAICPEHSRTWNHVTCVGAPPRDDRLMFHCALARVIVRHPLAVTWLFPRLGSHKR